MTLSLQARGARVDKPWGYEILLSPQDAPYVAKIIHVFAGERLSLQVHDQKVETQTLIRGRGVLVLEDADGELHEIPMQPNLGYHVAVGQRHRLCAAPDEDAVIFEASSPEVGTTYRLEDDYARPDETEQLRRAERASLVLDNERLWAALCRVYRRLGDQLGLEVLVRRLRTALVELGVGDDADTASLPPSLERVLEEVPVPSMVAPAWCVIRGATCGR